VADQQKKQTLAAVIAVVVIILAIVAIVKMNQPKAGDDGMVDLSNPATMEKMQQQMQQKMGTPPPGMQRPSGPVTPGGGPQPGMPMGGPGTPMGPSGPGR
jgi:hypothetical protein